MENKWAIFLDYHPTPVKCVPPHLKDAHPVPVVGLQGGGESVAAGDRGCVRVAVRDVDEQHLGEVVCWRVGGRARALHADLRSAGK